MAMGLEIMKISIENEKINRRDDVSNVFLKSADDVDNINLNRIADDVADISPNTVYKMDDGVEAVLKSTDNSATVSKFNTLDVNKVDDISEYDLKNSNGKKNYGYEGYKEQKRKILEENKARGKEFQNTEYEKFKQQYAKSSYEITIVDDRGVKTRVDAIGIDDDGRVIIYEYKSSDTATLTDKQDSVFSELINNKGVEKVVGKGDEIKGGGYFKNGFVIDGNNVTIHVVRPSGVYDIAGNLI